MSDNPKPFAFISIKVSAFIPNPLNPEFGNLFEADPIRVDIFPRKNAKSKNLPDGLIKKFRTLIEELTELCFNHVFDDKKPPPVPPVEQPKLNDEGLIKGSPEVTVFIPGADGRPVALPQILDAQGVEIGD